MITSIELGDFLSHSETKLDLENGVTVFVGQNGAGKSSIIDAITFALFGKHTRKSSKGLIRRGATQGFSKIEFTINGTKYQAVRKIDSKGGLAARFSKEVNGEQVEIAVGERKQFGESMTKEVEKTIGLDFEKLKIASIVQQGELNSIIKAKPKEFKELLNAVIGIDKLDIASNAMKEVSKNFRERIKEKIGYDDTHIDILQRDLERYQKELKEALPQKESLKENQENLHQEINDLQAKIDRDSPKIEKIKQLESRKRELQDYVKKTIMQIQHEIMEKERKVKDCEKCLDYAGMQFDFDSKIQKISQAIEETQKKIQELTNQAVSLKEKQLLAKKLQLKDNKCPVCDSVVEKLNPLFQDEHLKAELDLIQNKISASQKEKEMYNKKRTEFSEKLQKAINADAILKAHSINNQEEIIKIKKEIEDKRTNIQKIPILSNNSLLEMSQIDSHSKFIFENIIELEEETRNFDEKEFTTFKLSIKEKQLKSSQIDQQIGAIDGKISKGQEQIKIIQNAISELIIVKKYMTKLDNIHSSIFSRDGSVATSLRSWALNAISAKASEYLMLLNTKIQRIHLTEKARDITIMCYSKKESLDLESLSGGEQVSVALALRLGMANLLGASNLNMMILDEPTTHLDAERKKSLVGVLSQLGNIANSETPMQFIIITHDAEIFEDSTVERIYRFESTEDGSKVISV